MADKTYTKGAMRAAKALGLVVNSEWVRQSDEKTAAIITRETGDARLIEALTQVTVRPTASSGYEANPLTIMRLSVAALYAERHNTCATELEACLNTLTEVLAEIKGDS